MVIDIAAVSAGTAMVESMVFYVRPDKNDSNQTVAVQQMMELVQGIENQLRAIVQAEVNGSRITVVWINWPNCVVWLKAVCRI